MLEHQSGFRFYKNEIFHCCYFDIENLGAYFALDYNFDYTSDLSKMIDSVYPWPTNKFYLP